MPTRQNFVADADAGKAVVPGRGFNTLKGDLGGYALEQGDPPSPTGGFRQDYEILSIKTLEELRYVSRRVGERSIFLWNCRDRCQVQPLSKSVYRPIH